MNELQAVTSAAEPPLSRKLHAVGRKLGVPVAGSFELTSRCNFSCGMCYIHDADQASCAADELTAEQWLEIGKQAADAGTVFVLLTGGEPLIRRDFTEIYTGLKKLGLMISINTNGSLITDEIAALFEKNPPMRLNISLYADSEEGYLRQCGVNAYAQVVSNIRRMKNAGVQVKLNVSFTKKNADRYRQLADLVRELELHCQTSVYMYPPVRKSGKPVPCSRLAPSDAASLRVYWDLLRGKNEQLKLSAEQLARLAARDCDEAGAPGEGVRCRAGHTAYWISASGEMLMCGMIPLSAGNVRDDGFGFCWQKTRDLMKTVRMPAKCTTCRLRPVCCVCPAACFAETGDFSKAPPYLCEMSRSIAMELSRLEKEEPDVKAE